MSYPSVIFTYDTTIGGGLLASFRFLISSTSFTVIVILGPTFC